MCNLRRIDDIFIILCLLIHYWVIVLYLFRLQFLSLICIFLIFYKFFHTKVLNLISQVSNEVAKGFGCYCKWKVFFSYLKFLICLYRYIGIFFQSLNHLFVSHLEFFLCKQLCFCLSSQSVYFLFLSLSYCIM